MGLSMTEFLLSNGHTVIAAVRKPDSMGELQAKYGPARLLVVKVDVQNEEDIEAAFKKAKDVFGRIDVVHNNAGYSCVGEVEAVPMSDAKDMFEVSVGRICVHIYYDVACVDELLWCNPSDPRCYQIPS
jgi:NADP-dependent 3-hydroxy acid dehydrogenase YdfG